MNKSVSVIFPTYNEAGSIAAAVSLVDEVLTREHEIIVVDDDSPDGTADVVDEQWADRDDVQVIVRTEESGLSSAVLRGMDEAEMDVYAVMDADLQHPPSSLPVVLAGVDAGADVSVGSRHVETGDVAADWPIHRRIISWGATALAWAAVPQARALTDPMSGFFAIRAECVDAVPEGTLRPHGYKILLELLARCPVEDVTERGYTFEKREEGESNLGPAEYWNYAIHLARLSIPSRRSTDEVLVDVDGTDQEVAE